MNRNFLLILGTIIIIALLLPSGGKQRSVSGILPPVQEQASGETTFTINGYNIKLTFLYSYNIEALVVHKKNYSSHKIEDKLVPVDLALAWGKVAQYNKEIDFHWSQSGRWLFWRVDSDTDLALVGGMNGIISQASNNHLIPANISVKNKIKKIKKGDHIKIKGYLVNVYASKSAGNRWDMNSSISREDTGSGACEIIYVTDIYKIS